MYDIRDDDKVWSIDGNNDDIFNLIKEAHNVVMVCLFINHYSSEHK